MAAGGTILMAGALVMTHGAWGSEPAPVPGARSGGPRLPEPGPRFDRGCDLDRGDAYAVALAGIPVNLASTVWGPGRLDTSFWLGALEAGPARVRRGPHDLGAGAFALAGSERRDLPLRLDRPRLAAEWGPYGNDRYARLLWCDTRPAAGALFTYALEGTRSGRPWADLDGSARVNLALQLGRAAPAGDWRVTLLATREQGDGGAPDPVRPLPPGTPDLHPGDGLRTRRLFLAAARSWEGEAGAGARLQGYAGGSRLGAWSTWTGFLRDPERGDQLELLDRRTFAGLEGSLRWRRAGAGGRWDHRLGFQTRADRVAAAEVYATADRVRLAPWLQAHADLLHGALYARSAVRLGPSWRAWAGLRLDGRLHHARPLHPGSPFPGSPGTRHLALDSPALGLAWRPGPLAEVRLAHSRGFRPGSALRDLQPMTRAAGTDLDLQTRALGTWTAGITLWTLDLDAEIVPDPGWNAFASAGRSRRHRLAADPQQLRLEAARRF